MVLLRAQHDTKVVQKHAAQTSAQQLLDSNVQEVIITVSKPKLMTHETETLSLNISG